MENESLIVKKADSYDKRAYRIFLTNEGERLKKQVDSIMNELAEKALQGVTKRDEDASLYVLFKMIENITE